MKKTGLEKNIRKAGRLKKLGRMSIFDYLIYAIIAALGLLFLYPVVLTLSMSFSDSSLMTQSVYLLPVGFNLESYAFLLGDDKIIRYYANSVLYAGLGALLFLVCTSLMAYPMTVAGFKGKKAINLFMVITMFFSGGLVPYYFVIRGLKMLDTIWPMIIPSAIGAYNVVVFRTFFANIPAELKESAFIDGAGHMTVLCKIVLPVSKPLLATFALFALVGRWNDFLSALMFLRRDTLMPIQILLRKLLVLSEFMQEAEGWELQMAYSAVSSRSIKCAAVIITILPIMCVYPFMQKHFAKGMLVGALKA
jgi:putative aldouronate transport system permease protein